MVGAAGRRPGNPTGQEAPGNAATQCRRQQAEDLLLELLVSLPRRDDRHRIPQSGCDKGNEDLGVRRIEARRPAHERGAACYNPAHKHGRPEESVEGMPKFFKALYDTAREVKPDALVEFCPCGTAYSFFTLPFLNMSVASDPESAWQVRTKGKTLKALQGDSVAYFGDHVDMTKDDFASTVGVGGVVGTNFTWPEDSAERKRNDLTPAREQKFEKWLRIYKEKMLSRGEYLGGLYDIGFDRPEAHAISKDGNLYYAFYAPHWTGKITLRGLAERAYQVTDYVDGKDLGTVRGPVASLDLKFDQHLLLE